MPPNWSLSRLAGATRNSVRTAIAHTHTTHAGDDNGKVALRTSMRFRHSSSTLPADACRPTGHCPDWLERRATRYALPLRPRTQHTQAMIMVKWRCVQACASDTAVRPYQPMHAAQLVIVPTGWSDAQLGTHCHCAHAHNTRRR